MKSKAIDLGALQDQHVESRREYMRAKKEMEKAQIQLDSTRKKYLETQEELKRAAATVTSD